VYKRDFRLQELRPGDVISIFGASGRHLDYVVERSEQYSKDRFPTGDVYRARGEPSLRLVTCDGGFDRSSRSYVSNLVVFASLAPEPSATQS
jgi:hypothetical protein